MSFVNEGATWNGRALNFPSREHLLKQWEREAKGK
jgi:hypothetical protein